MAYAMISIVFLSFSFFGSLFLFTLELSSQVQRYLEKDFKG